MAGVGFPRGEDVISRGINQSTPSQSSPAIREKERDRKRPMKGERVEIWNEGKLSEEPPSPPYPVFTLDWLSLLPLFLLPSPLSSSFFLHRLLFTIGRSRGEGQRLGVAHRWTVLMKRWRLGEGRREKEGRPGEEARGRAGGGGRGLL